MNQSTKSILNSVLDLPSNKRNAFIEDACAGDNQLKQDVLILLSQSDNEIPENVMESAKSVIGDVIGPYEIEGVIGAGGMGMIHKAKDTRLDRLVALKCLPPHLTIDNQNRERFLNEARAVSRLDHPNICTLYDIGETEDKQLYLAMPLYDGYTLDKLIANGPTPWYDVISICLQICQGLQTAHKNNIVHRDIKPANIIVTSDNIVKILDFGVAKIGGVNLTSTGVALGTMAYMSPEQLEGKSFDGRTDIWAVGVLMYELLTGERPFKGDQAPAIMHAVLFADLPNFEFPAPIPEDLTLVMEKSLNRSVDQRYPSFQEFSDDLRRISAKTPVSPSEKVKAKAKVAVSIDATKVNFNQITINELIKELTEHVGPMAAVLVNKAADSSNDFSELCQKLDEHLPDDATRKKMRDQFNVLSSSQTSSVTVKSEAASFTDAQIDCLISTSTSFIGPIAKMLVQRYSRRSQSSDELSFKLAEHLESDSEKSAFIKKAKTCF